MGMGMLFAGALTGGARALGEIADDQIKSNAAEKSRQQQIADRREELLYQMQLKTDFAAAEEKREAEAYVSAQDRGKQIGDDRRFGKFKEDMLASGYGEGMDEAQIRKVFDEHYNDKVVTSEAGGDRYYDPESADSRDALQAARSGGAPGATIKALDAEYKGMLNVERQLKKDADREAREERRSRERIEADERRFTQQDKLLEKRLDAQASRGGGSGGGGPIDQTEKLSVLKDVKAKADASKPKRSDYGSEKRFEEAMGKWQTSDDGRMSAEASRRIMDVFGSRGEDGAPPPKAPAAVERGVAGDASGDVAANERSIARLKSRPLNRGESQSSRDEQIRMIERENEKLRATQNIAASKSSLKDNPTTSKPATTGARVGESRVVQSGPHKGKTAIWDGNGWALK